MRTLSLPMTYKPFALSFEVSLLRVFSSYWLCS